MVGGNVQWAGSQLLLFYFSLPCSGVNRYQLLLLYVDQMPLSLPFSSIMENINVILCLFDKVEIIILAASKVKWRKIIIMPVMCSNDRTGGINCLKDNEYWMDVMAGIVLIVQKAMFVLFSGVLWPWVRYHPHYGPYLTVCCSTYTCCAHTSSILQTFSTVKTAYQ